MYIATKYRNPERLICAASAVAHVASPSHIAFWILAKQQSGFIKQQGDSTDETNGEA